MRACVRIGCTGFFSSEFFLFVCLFVCLFLHSLYTLIGVAPLFVLPLNQCFWLPIGKKNKKREICQSVIQFAQSI